MAYHNDTCGCAECRNYGQRYNPKAIHNQSCGCAECGNYGNSVPVNYSQQQTSSPSVPSPVTLAAAANVSNSYGCTISNSDSQVVAESFGLLITTIDASVAPEKQKQEAKDLLKAFVSHPLAIQLLGELAEQLASLLGKKKPKKAVTPTGR